jgi:hypothetical protein
MLDLRTTPLTDKPELTQARKAALYVCGAATTVEEAREVMASLGLTQVLAQAS